MSTRLPSARGPLLGTVIGSLVILGATPATAGPTELLVPAYFYPTAGGDWDRLHAAARQVALTAILNPGSGPGVTADRNYVQATGALRAAGGKVVGYVHTSYGDRKLADVEADIARYTRLYKVDGFFIDEMANDLPSVGYYRSIYSYVKSLDPRYRVIGNPGTAIPEAYLTTPTADTLVTFEGPGDSYAKAKPADYAGQHPAGRFANIVHGVPTPDAMLDGLASAGGRNVGVVYVTDNADPANPYSRLPTHFDREVAALKAAAVVPVPASKSILPIGFVAPAFQRRRRSEARRLP